jgi:hypothetical protein
MARMTRKLISQIWDSTQKCWDKALDDYYNAHPKKIRAYSSRDIFAEDKEPIDQLYRNNMKSLSTEELELIIESYKKGKIKRAPVTIDFIMSELLERHMENK